MMMSEVDKEFAEKALNDIDFAKDQQRYMDGHNSEANKFSAYADDYASKRAEAEKQQANFNARTTPIRDVAFYLSRMEEMSGGRYGPEYGQISEAATKYLDNLVKNGLSAKEAAKAQKNQTTLDAITEVRDKAAKEIELRAEARENIGIKDAQANTGIDRLADKAKAMEGMTPEQRLAFRMSQLRGTAKETPAKPIIKREMDSNIMNKALESKMRA